MKYHRCYVCRDEIHPVNLKEVIGTDGVKYHFHHLCFNQVEEETNKTLGLIQKQIDKMNNEILRKAIIKLILSIVLICYIIKWFLTRS